MAGHRRTLVEANGVSGIGIGISGRATITDCVTFHNVVSGVVASDSVTRVTLEATKITDNGNYGVNLSGGVVVQTMRNNTIVNSTLSDVTGGSLTPIGPVEQATTEASAFRHPVATNNGSPWNI